jgi:hypothetical protein
MKLKKWVTLQFVPLILVISVCLCSELNNNESSQRTAKALDLATRPRQGRHGHLEGNCQLLGQPGSIINGPIVYQNFKYSRLALFTKKIWRKKIGKKIGKKLGKFF